MNTNSLNTRQGHVECVYDGSASEENDLVCSFHARLLFGGGGAEPLMSDTLRSAHPLFFNLFEGGG